MDFAGWIQLALIVAGFLLITKPLGVYMAKVFSRERTFLDPVVRPIERLLYRLSQLPKHSPKSKPPWCVFLRVLA